MVAIPHVKTAEAHRANDARTPKLFENNEVFMLILPYRWESAQGRVGGPALRRKRFRSIVPIWPPPDRARSPNSLGSCSRFTS
jgi:hypothetical protein